MKNSTWIKERNRELLQQIVALRDHAWEDNTPWSVSLKMLEGEIQKALDRLVSLLEAREKELASLKSEWQKEKENLKEASLSEKDKLEDKIKDLRSRIQENERARDEELYRWKEKLRSKETEIEQLKHLQGIESTRKRKKSIRRLILLVTIALLAVGGVFLKNQVFWRVQTYVLPYDHPSSFTVLGNQLLISDWVTQSLYFHRLDRTLSILKVVNASGFHFSGLAGEGKKILGNDKWQRKIFTLSFTDSELQQGSSISSPGPKPGGLFIDDDFLWSTDPRLQKIFRHRLGNNSETPQEYSTPQLHPISLFRRGDFLWVLDGKMKKIVRKSFDASSKDLVNWEPVVNKFGAGRPQPIAIGADEKSLWVLTIRPPQLLRYNFRYLGIDK